jgi:hypothetical protein
MVKLCNRRYPLVSCTVIALERRVANSYVVSFHWYILGLLMTTVMVHSWIIDDCSDGRLMMADDSRNM